jgi:hypothetical protein
MLDVSLINVVPPMPMSMSMEVPEMIQLMQRESVKRLKTPKQYSKTIPNANPFMHAASSNIQIKTVHSLIVHFGAQVFATLTSEQGSGLHGLSQRSLQTTPGATQTRCLWPG